MTTSAGAIHDGRSYYGRPILKEPVWTWEIPLYFFLGGLGGAGHALAFGARVTGNDVLARRTQAAATGALGVSPLLLVSDLGRPERFLNMLRVFKPTSPMSVGTWLLTAGGAAGSAATVLGWARLLPRTRTAAEAIAAVAGLPIATYTAALVAQTAVPVWHDARRELPFVFAAGSAASAGAATMLLVPPEDATPARRLAVAGGLAQLTSAKLMEKRLGELLSEPYRRGRSGRLSRLASGLTAAGALAAAVAGRRRAGAAAGGALLLAGAALEKSSVFEAGRAGARDPRYVVEPQRARRDVYATTRSSSE